MRFVITAIADSSLGWPRGIENIRRVSPGFSHIPASFILIPVDDLLHERCMGTRSGYLLN